jgi:hypothetical protein
LQIVRKKKTHTHFICLLAFSPSEHSFSKAADAVSEVKTWKRKAFMVLLNLEEAGE